MTDEVTFNKDSWHYAIATFANQNLRDWEIMNICSYTQSFLGGLWRIVLAIGTGGLMSSAIVSAWMWVGFEMMYEFGSPVTIFVALGVLIHALVLIALGFALGNAAIDAFIHYRARNTVGKEPCFISKALEAWRDRVCFKINWQ